MPKSAAPNKSLANIFIFLMVIYGVQQCKSHISELLLDEEDIPTVVAANLNHYPPPEAAAPPTHEENTCHVEFTVLKRGHCVRIGKATRACVSGTYIHPFHPDCM